MEIKVSRKKFYALLILLAEFFLYAFLRIINYDPTYYQMAMISITQLLFNIVVLKIFVSLDYVSIPNLFMVFTFLFHCGQFLKMGFNINGIDYFPIERYAAKSVIVQAFFFYSYSQTLYNIGLVSSLYLNKADKYTRDKLSKKMPSNSKMAGKVLIFIGIIPRLFIDCFQIYISYKSGYMALFTNKIPQFLFSLAFFFDAGFIFLLLSEKNKKKTTRYFWLMLIYKAITMLSGSRQEKVCFLIIWLFLYYFIINRINARKLLSLTIIGIIGYSFISSIGTGREISNYEFVGISTFFKSFEETFGSSLSEFGSALNTLVIGIRYTPNTIPYGFGLSFLAAIVSCIPLLVAHIPILADKTIFITQLPDSVYHSLGGSYLGELYYNFSWFGCLVCIIIGFVMSKIHNEIKQDYPDSTSTRCFLAVISTVMFLYVRGYITDMAQKLIWLYVVLLLIRYIENKNDKTIIIH